MKSDSHFLAKKHIFITGGARGIGRAIALGLAKQGASVSLTARTQADLDETAAELKYCGEHFLCIKADVTDKHQMSKAYSLATEKFGPIYGLVCAAGIYGALGAFASTPFEEWVKAIEVNLIGTARSIHQALPLMARADARILLFSGGGQGPMPNFSSYVTSKGGIWRLTDTLASELKELGIYLNSIAPGAVNTKLLDDVLSAGPEVVGEENYRKSLQQKESGGQTAEKAVALCEYLLSPSAKGLFGKTLSAVWDPYLEIQDADAISRSDIYTYRRVVDPKGNTRAT